VQSIETSSLHLDLISDLKRINSHICSIAYPILDSAGALSPTRFKQQVQPEEPSLSVPRSAAHPDARAAP
jgi:phosphate:Na+ symporter